MNTNIGRVRLFDGIAHELHALSSAGVRLAIVTSNSVDNVQQVLGADLVRRMTHLDTGAGLFGKKRRLERVVKSVGVARHEAIYVGDQSVDAEAAGAAGLAFGAVHWGYATPALLARSAPVLTFEAVPDLRRIAPVAFEAPAGSVDAGDS
jgi:phosphoglycolate phosphatase